MFRTRWRFIAAACSIAVASMFILLFNKSESSSTAERKSVDARMQPTREELPKSAERPQTGAPSTADVQNTQFSLVSKVRDLSNSSSPADAFRAYNILVECKWAKEEEKSFTLTREAERDPVQAERFRSGEFAARLAQACGNLSDTDLMQRLPLVERAAVAGVPLAAIQLANEGPWGDVDSLYTRPQDPQVLEWRRKVSNLIHLAATKGDVAALSSLASQYATGSGVLGKPDPKLALQYAVAQNIVYEGQTGKSLYGRDRQIKELAAKLSPEAAADAKVEGEKIASVALGRN